MSSNPRVAPPWWRGRTSGILSGIFLLLLVGGGIFVAATPPAHHTATATTPATTSTRPRPAVEVPAAARSVCGLDGYDTGGTLSAAPTVPSWVFVGLLQVPDDPHGAGPGRIDGDGYRSCFAHTKAGAVVAATAYIGDTTSDTLVTRMVQDAVLPGPGQQAALQRLSYGRDNSNTTRLTIQGVRLLSYSASTAVVDVALVFQTGQMFGEVQTLTWSGGDWRVLFTDAGQPPVPVTRLGSLDGYLPFQAGQG